METSVKPSLQILIVLAAAACFAACGPGPVKSRLAQAGAGMPVQHAQIHRRSPEYLPEPVLEPMEPLQRTVEDVLNDFGPQAESQLKPYFQEAGVAYPPRAITLVGLKAERRLELWARDEGAYRMIRWYPVMAASGGSGPKLRQGDRQVPEGVYRVVGLNPNSRFHLSMKLDYPNEFDLYHSALEGRDDPGSDIFIHGSDVSAGCLAMGDEAIEELFVVAAQTGPENVKVVIAPRDPRNRPLQANSRGLPSWTPELYDAIAGEIQALAAPVRVSRNSQATVRGAMIQR
jgi:hypothetical protein